MISTFLTTLLTICTPSSDNWKLITLLKKNFESPSSSTARQDLDSPSSSGTPSIVQEKELERRIEAREQEDAESTSLPSLFLSDRYCICLQSEKTQEEVADIEPSLPNSRCGRIRRLATLPLIPGLTALPTGRQEQHTHLVERSKMAI